jgi:DNA-binding GntR family transcriptional regulator
MTRLDKISKASRRTRIAAVEAPAVTVLPMPRQTMATLTLTALRDRILRGVFAEGAPLRQDALAEELGVSRIPIREALRQLESEGLVTFNPHRGAIVSTLSLPEIEEVFSLRANLEVELLTRALPKIGPSHLRQAEAVLATFKQALERGDMSAWGELNWQFHSTLYAPSDRPVTMEIVRRLHRQSERYLRLQIAFAHGAERADGEHRAIVRAVRAGDKRSIALMRAHIEGAGRALLDFLQARTAKEGRTKAQRARR